MPEPMDVARHLIQATQHKRDLDLALSAAKKDVERLSADLLELIEQEKLPESFKLDGATIFTREEIWASPEGGDHARLTRVLKYQGLVEYLPRTVNSQSMSAYVREHYDPDTDTFDLPEDLLRSLKITQKTKAVINFGS